MLGKKLSRLDTVKRILKGEFDLAHTELIKDDGTIVDSHPLQGKLLVLRITGKDESKNTVRKIGSSQYLLISESTKQLLCNNNGELKNPIQQGYNEIDNHRVVFIDCGLKGGE